MNRCRRPNCKHCGDLYTPTPRRGAVQKFCSKPACQKASRVDSQHRWLAKPENKTHFCGPENVLRTQEWRKKNPGYWRRRKRPAIALQDVILAQPVDIKSDTKVKTECSQGMLRDALQDVDHMQHPLIVGVISFFTGATLQDEIAQSIREIQTRGVRILGEVPGMRSQRGENNG